MRVEMWVASPQPAVGGYWTPGTCQTPPWPARLLQMRCLECEAETADAQFCVLCGASVIHQLSLAADPAAQVSLSSDASAGHWPPRPAPDSEVCGTVLAEWVKARKFSTTRQRPGYDQEELDAFLAAIRDSFLGVRRPSLRPDEIRGKQFSTVRLRPGYDVEEVDAFLDEAELRLAAQGSDLDTGKAQDGEPELGADSLPVQDQPATSQTYLIAAACLVGGLVSVWLAVTEIAENANHDRVGNLVIPGMIIGALAGLTALAVNDGKPPGWANRINTVAALLAAIGFFSLLSLFLGQHGWVGEGLCKTFLEEVKSNCGSER
jgi:DivIVA domain-containing protein